jgi:tRNA threonylcarbamoyladenosine biosynthesis protein TsaE
MNNLVYNNCTLEDLPSIARAILDEYPDERIFAFFGDLGAGKTTLIKALCRALGVEGDVTSPTFAIINEYDAGGIDLVYHFDFYRIKKAEEALDIGYEEYLDSSNYCFIEWADKIEELLPGSYVYISVVKGDNENTRMITTSFKVR